MSNSINNTEDEPLVAKDENNALVSVAADTQVENNSKTISDIIAITENQDKKSRLDDMGLTLPTEAVELREDAYLHSNGTAIMNACSMFYGGAKTGKTRLLTKAFNGSGYIFLDFDRNYTSTVNGIIESGALYFNGKAALDILYQIMDKKLKNTVVVVDALGSVIKRMCNRFITNHTNSDDLDEDAILLKDSIRGIGINHSDSVTFFNLVIEPMTKNGNSINFIHHTTQNMGGEKMEGNKGAWLSVFDFTYSMNREKRVFELEAGRLPIALETIGEDNIYDRLNKMISDKAETITVDENQKLLTKFKYISDNKSLRTLVNPMILDERIEKIKVGRIEYLDSTLLINTSGQFSSLIR